MSMSEMQGLGYALALGLLIGLERGWAARDGAAGTRVAGFRTFGVLGLSGGVAGLLPGVVTAAGVLMAGIVLAIGYYRQSRQGDRMSATLALVGLVTFLLGVASTQGYSREAIATAAVLALLLSMRDVLHGWLKGLEPAEVRAALRFAIIAIAVLPFLPDRQMGPLDAWNPHKLWLVVVLVCGLSFVGYVAARRVGTSHGLLVAALCGSIVSSTAVTAAFARRLRIGDGPPTVICLGIGLASCVMYVRVLLLTALVAPIAMSAIAWIIGPALLLCLATALAGWRRGYASPVEGSVPLGNPLEIGVASGLAALVAAISVASRWALDQFGHTGLATILMITGFADVDAAILAMGNLPVGALDGDTAGIILASPVFANTILKIGLTLGLAPTRTGFRAAAALITSLAGGVVAAAFLMM